MAKRGTDVVVSKSPFGEIDRLFDGFWMRPFAWERPFADFSDTGPSVDVIDRDDEVVVRAEVPGFRKEDIEVSVSGDMLTLSGKADHEDKEEKGNYYRAEIARSAFSRTIMLPAEVDDSKAKASMRDGVLELTLPKVERSKRRTITIS